MLVSQDCIALQRSAVMWVSITSNAGIGFLLGWAKEKQGKMRVRHSRRTKLTAPHTTKDKEEKSHVFRARGPCGLDRLT